MAFSTDQYAWKDISVNVLGRTLQGIKEVRYKVTSDDERVYGRGNKALAIQKGNESVEGQLMLLQSEYEQFRATVKAANPLNKPTDVYFDIIVTYGQGNSAVTDIIKSAKFTEYEKGMSQEDKFMEITLPFIALDVEEGL